MGAHREDGTRAKLSTIKLRRGTAAQWDVANPILANGEPGFESDTGRQKIGDGTSAWAKLEYFLPELDLKTVIGTELGGVGTPARNAADAIYGRRSVFEEFSNSTDWLDSFRTQDVPRHGTFTVTDGKGILTATGNNDVYLSTVGIPFAPGFTVVAQTQRTADNGGFTEFEMGVDGTGFIWHFQWSATALQFIRNTRNGLLTDQNVSFRAENPVLRFYVTCSRRRIHYFVLDVTNSTIVMNGSADLDFAVDSNFEAGSHINFVTTGDAGTTLQSPVTQSIDFFSLSTGPQHLATEAAFSKVFTDGGNVVRSTGGGPITHQSARNVNVAGGGVARGGTVEFAVDFPQSFPGMPMVNLTLLANREGGGIGECKAWLTQVTEFGFRGFLRNEAAAQTFDLHWSADYNG